MKQQKHKDMKKVIVFARVSTVQQDLTEQLAAVKSAVLADGYLENEILEVTGKESAIKLKEEERQTLNEIKTLVAANPTVNAIYFFAVDRLARRMSVIMSVKEWADENKINLVFLNPQRMQTLIKNERGEMVENEITTLLLSMLSYGAQMEMRTKKARFQTVKEAMRKQGKITQGTALFGYKVDDNKYVVADEEHTAPIVRSIFSDYLTGKYTLCSIYNKYMKSGDMEITTNSSSQKRRMYQILTNKKYAGYAVKSEKKNKDTGEYYNSTTQYPAIISKEMFNDVQSLLKEKRSLSKQDTKHIYLGKGIVKCDCGHTMAAHSSSVTYRCDAYEHFFAVNLNVVDSLIWHTAKELYSYYATQDTTKTKEYHLNKIKDFQAELVVLDEKIKTEEDKKDKIAVKYANGKVNEKVFDRIVQDAEEMIAALTNTKQDFITKIETTNKLLKQLDNKKQVNIDDLEGYTDTQKVEVINKVIKEVKVTRISDKDVKIEFTPLVDIPKQLKWYSYAKCGAHIKLSAFEGDKEVIKDASYLVVKRFTRK